jgi:Zn-finger nucleic acid-binding protein
MTPRFFYGVEIDVCPKCGGIWMDDGELAQLGQSAAGALRQIDQGTTPPTPTIEPRPNRQLRCPRDGEAMSAYQFSYNSGITLDSCPTCSGVFLDHGELTSIAEFRESGGLRRGPDPKKVEELRAKRHQKEFGDPNQRKLPPQAAEMLATLQGQSAEAREREMTMLRLGYTRHYFGGSILGAIVEELLDMPVRY